MALVLSDPSCSSLIELKSSTNDDSWQRHCTIGCQPWYNAGLYLSDPLCSSLCDTVHYVVSEHYQMMVYEMKHHWLVSPKPIPASSTCCTGTAARSLWIAVPVAFSSATKLNLNGQLKQWSPPILLTIACSSVPVIQYLHSSWNSAMLLYVSSLLHPGSASTLHQRGCPRYLYQGWTYHHGFSAILWKPCGNSFRWPITLLFVFVCIMSFGW